jgi:thiosulfate dehydrogenase
MKSFSLGILFTLAVLLAGGYWLMKSGRVDFGADQQPSATESKLAMAAVDASTDRRAPVQDNPVQPTEENLVAGAKLYLNHCGGCHGVPSHPNSTFAVSFYPPVPGFFEDAPDMSENQNFYIIQHGIRWTGMPAWKSTLDDTQIWQTVVFLSHLNKLPDAAQKVFDSAAAATQTKVPDSSAMPNMPHNMKMSH